VKERLRLVTDFSELRAGMIVVIKPCNWCGAVHRGIIAKKVISRPTLIDESGGVELASGWGVLPAPSCDPLPILIAADDPLGNVYRVEDGLEDTQITSTSTPAPSRKKARA